MPYYTHSPGVASSRLIVWLIFLGIFWLGWLEWELQKAASQKCGPPNACLHGSDMIRGAIAMCSVSTLQPHKHRVVAVQALWKAKSVHCQGYSETHILSIGIPFFFYPHNWSKHFTINTAPLFLQGLSYFIKKHLVMHKQDWVCQIRPGHSISSHKPHHISAGAELRLYLNVELRHHLNVL